LSTLGPPPENHGFEFYGEGIGGVELEELRGRLIVIEGTDGVGRSTQVSMLKPWLEQNGHAVLDTGMTRSALAGKGIKQAKEGHTLGQLSVVAGMAASAGLLLARRVQPLQRKLAQHLQHAEARAALGGPFHLHQAGIYQRRQRQEWLVGRRFTLGPADRLRCLQRPAAHKDAQRAKTLALGRGEQLVAPGNRVPHGLLARGEIARSAAQKRQPDGQPLQQVWQRKQADLHRGQFNR